MFTFVGGPKCGGPRTNVRDVRALIRYCIRYPQTDATCSLTGVERAAVNSQRISTRWVECEGWSCRPTWLDHRGTVTDGVMTEIT